MCYKCFIDDHVTFSQSGGIQVFQHSRELFKWLEKVRRVIVSLGKQKFYRQGSGLMTGGFVSGAHGLPLKLISCTLNLLSMLVDLLTGWRSW